MKPMPDAGSIVTQIAGALGPVGTALSAYVFRSVAKSSENAQSAHKAAKSALEVARKALGMIEGTADAFEGLKRTLRIELDTFKVDVEERFARPSRVSRSAFHEMEGRGSMDGQYTALQTQLTTLQGELQSCAANLQVVTSELKEEKRQREQLQQIVSENMKTEGARWLDLQRTLGRMESQIEDQRRSSSRP